MTYGEFRCHVLYYWWFSFVQSKKRRRKKRGKTRWVQTFLVVKRRNLQLSNKSLRLNPFCHWLKRATWHRRYEHELYAVVYSLVLPLYQQQTKLGRRNILFPFIVIFKEKKMLHSHLGTAARVIHQIPDFLTVRSSGQSPPLPAAACVYSPTGGNKTTGTANGRRKPARKDFSRQTPCLHKLLIAGMWTQPAAQRRCALCWYIPLAIVTLQLLCWTTVTLEIVESLLGVRLYTLLAAFLNCLMICFSIGWSLWRWDDCENYERVRSWELKVSIQCSCDLTCSLGGCWSPGRLSLFLSGWCGSTCVGSGCFSLHPVCIFKGAVPTRCNWLPCDSKLSHHSHRPFSPGSDEWY